MGFYEVDERNDYVRPDEIKHLAYKSLPDLWGMEASNDAEASRLAKSELAFRDAVYSRLGQG